MGIGAKMLTLCATMGFHMIVAGRDVFFLANASKQTSTEARAVLKDIEAAQTP